MTSQDAAAGTGANPKSAPQPRPVRTWGVAWADTVKALGLRALSFGKFWQLCFTFIVVAVVFCVPGEQWQPIIKEVLGTPIVAIGGWLAAILSIVIAVVTFKVHRASTAGEIERLTKERDRLQSDVLKGKTASSNYRKK